MIHIKAAAWRLFHCEPQLTEVITMNYQQRAAKRMQYQETLDRFNEQRPDEFEASERRARDVRRENQRRAVAAGGVA